jgi:hypothetical protein
MRTNRELTDIFYAARINAITNGSYPTFADESAMQAVRDAIVEQAPETDDGYFTFIDYSGLTETLPRGEIDAMLWYIRRDETRLSVEALSMQADRSCAVVSPKEFDRIAAALREYYREKVRLRQARTEPAVHIV